VRLLRIGFDVDEVCADLHSAWLDWGNATFDTNKTLADFNNWNAVLTWWGTFCWDFLRPHIYDQDIVKPITGARTVVEAVRALGYPISFVTSCLGDTAVAKYAWLRRHGFLLDGDSYIAGKDKSCVPVDVLVDDGYHNVLTFEGLWAVLLTRPWNANEAWGGARIDSLDQLIDLIQENGAFDGASL